MLKCIAIDDEPLALEKLSIFIAKVSRLQLERTFTSAIEALDYLNQHHTDLIFLDIQMEDFSGIQFLNSLKNRPFVIITSAYKEYAIEGYDFEVTDYLLKPFGFERFYIAVEKVFRHTQPKISAPTYLFVKTGYSLERIDIANILYIEGMNEYLQIVTREHKWMTLQSFRQMELLLPPENFLRVHKSYLVALDKIERIERQIIIIRGKRIPIGKSYKEAINRLLS